MARVVRTEKRQRGIFGWLFFLIFWAFQAFMVYVLFTGLEGTTEAADAAITDAERAGVGFGIMFGMGLLLMFWAMGTVILGALMWATGGRKVIVES